MFRFLLIAFLLSVVIAPQARAQAKAAGEDAGISRQDQQFLNYAAQDNQAEIQICLLAEKKAQNLAVKAFARLMVDDHVQVESQLAAVVNGGGVTVPSGVGEDGRKTLAQLGPLSGPGFDRQFIADQIKDHSHDVQRYSQEPRATQNQAVRQFASMTRPILEQHLQLARAVQDALRSDTGGNVAVTAPGDSAPEASIGQQ